MAMFGLASVRTRQVSKGKMQMKVKVGRIVVAQKVKVKVMMLRPQDGR